MHKVERLVNLIALLLNTRRPLTVEEIRNTVPGYQQEDYSSFKRMFERDKEELRAVGIPIERHFTDVWEIDEGYLISKDRYYLPQLDLTPEELAALWMASQVVVEEGGKEDQALLKLSLDAGLGSDPGSPPWLRARLYVSAPALPKLLEAVAGRKKVKFQYRPAGRSKDTERVVAPYALIHRGQGAWYVVGYDEGRRDVRHFKLQRISSPVRQVNRLPEPDFEIPEDFDLSQHSIAEPWKGTGEDSVDVAFSPRIAWWVQQSLGLESSATWKGWPVVRVPLGSEESFVSWVIGFGPEAVVRSPERIRKAVVSRLESHTNKLRRAPAPAR